MHRTIKLLCGICESKYKHKLEANLGFLNPKEFLKKKEKKKKGMGHGAAHHRTIIVQITTRPRPGFYLGRACSLEPMHTDIGPQPSNPPN